jgi:hypothetical protein
MSTTETELDRGLDLAGMELWTAWVSKLMAHAALQADDPRDENTLAGAAEDAASLRDALAAATGGWLDPGQTAVLRSIYELWAANHDRLERLAATVAPEWHRMWLGRSASARTRCAEAAAHPAPELSYS